MIRKIKRVIQGHRAIDGAGVELVRVVGNNDVIDFDPFLMMDAFDSKNPKDYLNGFPMHPHRGIETVTYLIDGEIEHSDSIGNRGTIRGGESQWMTSGSGILHEEMPKASERLLGVQLWINLPKNEKMTPPSYLSISKEMIPVVEQDNATIRVISGDFNNIAQGAKTNHVQAAIYDITLKPNNELTIETKEEDNVFLYLVRNNVIIDEKEVKQKSAILLGDGKQVTLKAGKEEARIMFFAGKPLHEPIAWAGPVVMNTQEELVETFRELDEGTFIR